MEIDCIFFGPIQEITGRKQTTQTVQQGTTVVELIVELNTRYEGLEDQLLTDGGDIHNGIVITVNKRHLNHLNGESTELSDGDIVRITTSIQGG